MTPPSDTADDDSCAGYLNPEIHAVAVLLERLADLPAHLRDHDPIVAFLERRSSETDFARALEVLREKRSLVDQKVDEVRGLVDQTVDEQVDEVRDDLLRHRLAKQVAPAAARIAGNVADDMFPLVEDEDAVPLAGVNPHAAAA
ncbi:hypothetical protein H9P43_007958 [Blastocladiella emersonii ATCC 22665]|nr:hypothetical protein H9P43_007958 [Blastocladiella emersonii ATCC 22665]